MRTQRGEGPTGILGVLGAHIVVARVQYILVHKRSAGRHLPEKRHLNWLSNLDALALGDKDLASVLAAVFAVQTRDAVLFRVMALLERLQRSHEIVTTGHTGGDDPLRDTSRDGALDDGRDRVHGPHDLALELRRHVQLDLLEEVFRRTETADHEHVLQLAVLCLDGDDLVPHELQDAVHNGLETLQDLLVGERHEALLDVGLQIVGLDADIDRPLLPVVSEVGLDPVLEVHDAFCVDLARRLGSIGKLHLADLCAQDVGEVAVKSSTAARVSGTGGTLGHRKGMLLFDLIRDQIDSSTTAIHNQHRIVNLQVQQPSLGTEHGCRLGFRDERQTVVILISQETGLDGRSTSSSLSCIVPNGRDGQEITDVALLSVEHLSQSLLQLSSHRLPQLEEVICRYIDLGLSRRKGRKVDRVNVCVSGKHKLELEPFHLQAR
jgi:hypothetical protein